MDTHDDPAPADAGSDPVSWSAARAAMKVAVSDPALSGVAAVLQRICRAATSALGLLGATVHVLTDQREAVVASSDATSLRVGELAFEVGEGPCLDAYALARPVLVPDLLRTGSAQWPGYLSALDGHGVRASYSFPLHVGAVRLGVLDLYDARVRSLAPDELALALMFATVATETLLEGPSGSSVALLDDPRLGVMDRRAEIHQAQGMVTVDLGVDLVAALALMRAHAFSRELTLLEMARLILAGERLPGPGDG